MVSIIIVNYKVKKELLTCIASIYASKTKAALEIIVVDNDEKKSVGNELLKKFPNVVYVANENRGFGEANNVGARHAKGEYLFFLNPDTEVAPGGIDNLLEFLQKKKNAGIVAPLLLGSDGKAYQQGTLELTPKRGIFALSFINKLFPRNSVSKQYFLADWDRKSVKEVDVAPGTAFMMKKSLFEEVGGFDEKFFLFFEEFDLCKRVKKLGHSIFIYPKSQVMHAWGVSTKQRNDIDSIFQKSRFTYFRKHFGTLSALVVEGFARMSKYTVLLVGILALGLFLRTYNLSQSMPFIGDQGWYYLSARDMVLTGNIPLVGIESSHPWLHQGALWTYILGGGFWVFGFNPFVGAYISVGLGPLGILGMYGVGRVMFSSRVGLIAAALFATSPLIVASDRMPYHTSPIPLFTIIFIYFLYKWVRGNKYFFPLIIFTLGILYNLELATALFGGALIVTLLYCFIAKRELFKSVFSFRFLVLSFIAFVVSMLPMLIYDVGHGFPQTLGFVAWLGYKVLVVFGYPAINPSTPVSWGEMLGFSVGQMKQLIFPYSAFVALGIFVGGLVFLLRSLLDSRVHGNDRVKRGSARVGMAIILILNLVLMGGFLAVRTPSDAYWHMMVPSMVLMVGAGLGGLIRPSTSLRLFEVARLVGVVGVLGLIGFNSYYSFIQSDFDDSFARRLQAAQYIVKESHEKEYNLDGKGPGSQFESFTMNYEYLTWWLGNGPAENEQNLRFTISEDSDGLHVQKKLLK